MVAIFRLRRFCFFAAFSAILRAADFTAAPQQFQQEIAHHRELTNGLPVGPVQLLELEPNGNPSVFVNGTWFTRRQERWEPLSTNDWKSDRFTVPEGVGVKIVDLPARSVIQLLRFGSTNYVVTDRDLYAVVQGSVQSLQWPSRYEVYQLAVAPDGILYLASAAGLHRRTLTSAWEPVRVADGLGRVWAAEKVLGVAFDSRGQLWFATRAGVGCRQANGWKFYEGRDGLPWNDFTGLAPGPNGEMWFGTRLGAIRWNGKDFQYRQGLRWLPHDEVRRVAVDATGNAWFATAQGVGWIERRTMTLAAKAEIYEYEMEHYIQRTPFGFVAEAPLSAPGDKSTAAPQDSDNDGLWTAMYGAGECFAYGATHDPKAKVRATKAFEALRFLQTVTQGGSAAAPKGYVARTIRPKDWPDPNVGRLEQDRASQKNDALWKAYELRWPKSEDGEWYWKSDTSSDELDGHYFFYALYHDLVAETNGEKERVRDVVRRLTDHLIAHGFSLTDHDGTPTRWGVYGPQVLNHDARWWVERGLNSLSILTYLSVAEHLTQDAKYGAAARELIDRHGYAQNLMFPKVQYGPGSGNQSDDEMAFMCFYTLLNCSKDEALKASVRYSFFAYWANEAPELNPFFNYAYAAHGLGRQITNVWGTYSINPWAGWQEESMATLYGFPLDRLNWAHRNSHRLDLVPLARQKSKDLYEPTAAGRGHQFNGHVLPIENRHFNHWNTDPWDLDYGGDGRELGGGTVFLLPYYLGLYQGYIVKP